MNWISAAISTIDELRNILSLLSTKSKSKNIHKKLIIRELRDNIKKYINVFKNKLSNDLLIDNISNTEIKNAIKDNFNFNKLTRGTISENLIKEPRNKKYIGWTAAKLTDKIDEKTEELKSLKQLNNGTVENLLKTRINLMLSNQFFRMKLLARFINE